MSFDASRFTFHPWHDYLGVVMQQGRVQLDADWNEWVAELGRRLQAGTMDTVGRAVVPRTTPEGFHILAAGGVLTIGPGRIYVDGLLAENHGAKPLKWDASLAEPVGGGAVSFFDQPYLRFNANSQPAPADIFNGPSLTGGPHLVYLDVWQRELTHLQADDLIEKAVGVDTTGRLQTVWQVKLLQNIGDADCSTSDGELPGWNALTRPSGARLSTSTGAVTGEPNPCLALPAAGYKGLENQLYRVEIHRGGPQATATFKWSRDNGTVATRVLEIQGGNRLVVESLGRDEMLGFHPGEWVEILDDWHEMHGRPGRLHRIRPVGGVDAATNSIVLETPLPAGLFPVNGDGSTVEDRHTRVRRWDQSGEVRRADGTVFHDLTPLTTSDGIPVPPAGTKLALEDGILVDFSVAAGGEFRVGDHWVFAARATDGTIEELDAAAPRGIHHHYARLAIATLPDDETDCRVLWPPETGNESCDCTVCVGADAHNAGTATIQQAIDAVRARGGGTICLDVGTYQLKAPLKLGDVRSLRLRGQGWRTVLQPTQTGGAIDITGGIGVAVEKLSIVGIAADKNSETMIEIANSVGVQLSELTIAALATASAKAAAVGLSGLLLSATIRDCVIVAERAIVTGDGKEAQYLFTANLSLSDNILVGVERGVSLDGNSLHYGQLRIVDNLVIGCAEAALSLTGAALPASSVTVSGNVLHAAGAGIVAGTDQLRIADNEIIGTPGQPPANGIDLVAGLDQASLDHVQIRGNRLHGVRGHGIHIDCPLGQARFDANMIEDTGLGGLIMSLKAAADYVCIEGNQFTNLGVNYNDGALPFVGVSLVATKRADVSNNVFANVARQSVLSPLRAAILAAATSQLRIAGNRLYGIGPLESFSGRTIGIAVAPGFVQVAVDDNTVSRLESDADKAKAASCQALLIIGTLAGEGNEDQGPLVMPGAAVLRMKTGTVFLSRARIVPLVSAKGGAMVRGNRFNNQASVIPAAAVLNVRGCLFDQNDIQAIGGEGDGDLAGRIIGEHASVANNRLTGSSRTAVFELTTEKEKFSVLGNLRTAPIIVNGTPDTALPAPWNNLNVAI